MQKISGDVNYASKYSNFFPHCRLILVYVYWFLNALDHFSILYDVLNSVLKKNYINALFIIVSTFSFFFPFSMKWNSYPKKISHGSVITFLSQSKLNLIFKWLSNLIFSEGDTRLWNVKMIFSTKIFNNLSNDLYF